MFTLVWLVGWLAGLREMLAARTAVALTDHTDEDGKVDTAGLFVTLFLMLRVFSYLAWFGQVSFLRQQARQNGTEMPFTPSMRGVPPNFVEDAIRTQLRLDDGVLKSPPKEAAERLSKRLGTWVDETARMTSVASAGMGDVDEMKASHRYAQEHGHPVPRFVMDVREDRSEVANKINEDEELKAIFDMVTDDYEDEFSQPFDVDDDADDALAAELAQIEADAIAAHERQVEASVVNAEIVWGLRDANGKKFPSGWARVPTGATTCAFCLLLCARGAVYRTTTVIHAVNRLKKGRDPMIGRYSPNAFHWHCDCIGVPVYKGEAYEGKTQVDGAAKVYADFQAAMKKTGGTLNPQNYRDWLHTPEGRASVARHIPSLRVVR